MGDLTKNFSRSEFACNCGCGFDKVDPRLPPMCQTIRDAMGQAIRINSGCRCEKHNQAAGSTSKDSPHTHGWAADLSCAAGGLALYLCIINLRDKGKLPDLSWACWYRKKNFVHIDCGPVRNNRFAVNNNN